jgi:hypothetical protein
MTVPRPRHPVPRVKVALGAVLVLAAVLGIIGLAEKLRHPLPAVGVPAELLEEPPADPRIAPECPEPAPLEVEVEETGEGGGPVEGRATTPVTVGSNDLYDCPEFYDGQTVRYQGEAVGAIMRREDGAWTQLNDDIYAGAGPLPSHREFRGGNAGVGVLLPPGAADAITVVGGPVTRGEVVEVVGTYQRIDRDTREVAVIRATELTVVERGTRIETPLLVDRLVAAILLAALAGAAVRLQTVVRRRRQRGVAPPG